MAGLTRFVSLASGPVTHLMERLALAAVALAGSACSSLQSSDSFLGVITPYRMDIVQGNVVTAEQARLVKPGMTRAQVRDALGTPMLTDLFHADRWDYVFTIKRPGTEPQRRSVVAFFKGDVLERLEAPNLPSEKEFVATISPADLKTGPSDRPLVLTDSERAALPKPPRVEATPAPITGPKRNYPPLEPA
ncbi:MAG: outer membrane protein assembly factor BamE [Ideonella sp.]|nr:outer membrane protein assembly factor BamE [Ideonella sp.]MBL0148673.1 outer membrane protein assembly factor BamE [Ideonella sp.]